MLAVKITVLQNGEQNSCPSQRTVGKKERERSARFKRNEATRELLCSFVADPRNYPRKGHLCLKDSALAVHFPTCLVSCALFLNLRTLASVHKQIIKM